MRSTKHFEIDQYARDSPLAAFDPRVKLASTLALIVAIAFLRDLYPLLISLAFLLFLIALSRVPVKHVAGNFALAVPFILLASLASLLTSGVEPATFMALRITDSVLALLILVTTTPFFDLLKALRWYRMPWIISSLLLFTYRFIFILIDELDRMKYARKARGFEGRGSLFTRGVFTTLSFTIGMVLVRSNIRAGNIYNALLSRGYTGEIRTLNEMRARPRDVAYAGAFALMVTITLGLQIGVIHWML